MKPMTGTFCKCWACCCMPDLRCSEFLAAIKGMRIQQKMQQTQPKQISPMNLNRAIASNIFRYSVLPMYSVPSVPCELYCSENMMTAPQMLTARPTISMSISTHRVHVRVLEERQNTFQSVWRTNAAMRLILIYIQRSWSGCYRLVISASSLLAPKRDAKMIKTRASQQRD